MKTFLILMLCLLPATALAQSKIKYGSNPAAAKSFMHDGVKFYFEVYGTGEPVLMVHGNGGSIRDMSAQIEHFRKSYKVIAMDSRFQGRSGDGSGKLTYEQMADDLAALIDHLKLGPVNVVGWSDGGIEALLLSMRNPTKVKKIAVMAANLNPSGMHPSARDLLASMLAEVPAERRSTPEGRREVILTELAINEPNIRPTTLQTIIAPTLVMAGDRDVITDEHTLEIYRSIPNSQLTIFPNSTHMAPYDDPTLFNSTVEQFFRMPFVKKDRIDDLMKSFIKMRS